MARAMLTAETRASGSATLPVLLCAGARTGIARPGVRSAHRARWRRPRAGTRLRVPGLQKYLGNQHRGSSVLPVSGPWTLLLAPAPQVCAVAGKAEVVGVEETTRRSISVGVPQVRTPGQVCLPRRPAPRRYEASSRGTFMCTREHIPRGGCTPMGQHQKAHTGWRLPACAEYSGGRPVSLRTQKVTWET
ncbi:uncharacterized protein LOC125152447 isoform X2 [Prionailurus viverrinus]|uniref:uncharacterized protein LOC125152447 isoform X2 n=1 Tax=Prionailurus viverrinus TaxID=61388 RepID=UPI001FF54F3B|nr:uncharacterized protein LOC125152447 isoform X2 [Prionailurus viverrinus]